MVFGRALDMGLSTHDDRYVYENPMVQKGLTWAGIAWAFAYRQIGHWHPLTWFTHMFELAALRAERQRSSPEQSYFHAATAILLFLVLRQMTGALWRRVFVALVFAIHPLRAESCCGCRNGKTC